MLRITGGVWDGTDYVPFRWQAWLDDRSGYLCVAAWNGRVVGLQHTSIQPDGTAWMEGIRVEEAVRGRGVGAALLHHSLVWACSAGYAVARLSTSSENQSSVRIAQKAGFRAVRRYEVLASPVSETPAPGLRVRLAHAGDLNELRRVLLEEWKEDGTVPFYTEGWTAYRLTAERIDLLVAVHAVAIVEDSGIDAVGIATASVGRPVLRLGYLDGSIEGRAAIVAWLREQARAASLEQIRATLPADPTTIAALQPLGFTSSVDFAMVLWETQLLAPHQKK